MFWTKNHEAFYKATNRPYLQLGMIRVPLNNNQSGCRHMPTSIANICACLCVCFVSGPYLWKVCSYKLIQELELRNIADCAVYFKSTDLSITPVPRITWRLRRKRWRNTTRCVQYVLDKLGWSMFIRDTVLELVYDPCMLSSDLPIQPYDKSNRPQPMI